MPTKPSRDTISNIVNYCNMHIVPDESYIASQTGYQSEWFERYFDFIPNHLLGRYLGESFYQARFLYKIMLALRLPSSKNIGFVKFQIIQYASICEALIHYVIETRFKDEYASQNRPYEFCQLPNALSNLTTIFFDKKPLFLCQKKDKKIDLKRERIDSKISFCRGKNIISESSAQQFKQLYDDRNNIHILKAVNSNYRPRVQEAKNAFLLMQRVRDEIKSFLESQSSNEGNADN